RISSPYTTAGASPLPPSLPQAEQRQSQQAQLLQSALCPEDFHRIRRRTARPPGGPRQLAVWRQTANALLAPTVADDGRRQALARGRAPPGGSQFPPAE